MNILKHHYDSVIRYDIITKFHKVTPCSVNNLRKLVLNFNIKGVNLKFLLSSISALELISSQRALITLASCSNISLKIKKGSPIGCKVTLRKRSLHSFFLDLVSRILPDIKQFEGFMSFKVRKSKSVSFKLKNIFNFTVIANHYELFRSISNLDISIITSSANINNLNVLLTSFRFPMK